MKRTLFILASILFCLPSLAKEKKEVQFFVRTFCDKKEVYQGDSILVSYILFANMPFTQVECKTKMKVKNARSRALNINRHNTLSRSLEKGRPYYTIVWEQYVIVPLDTGIIKLPELHFDATFNMHQTPRSPFESFFGNHTPTITIKATAKNELHILQVLEKPRRTTRELIREGGI